MSSGNVNTERLKVVEGLLVRCFSHQQIERHCAQLWGITTRTVARYIVMVYRQWNARDKETDEHKERQKTAYAIDSTYQMALESKDFRAANTALDMRIKFRGLGKPDQLMISGDPDAPVRVISTAEHKVSIEEALKKIAERATKAG